MIVLQIHTEKELIEMVNSLKKEIEQLRDSNKEITKKLKLMQVDIDKKPNVTIKETVIKQVEKPTILETTLIKTDSALMPSIKKLAGRVKALEEIKPIVNIAPKCISSNDVLELINKHVTMNHINKLYGN